MKPLPAKKKPVNLNFKQTWMVRYAKIKNGSYNSDIFTVVKVVGGLVAYTVGFAAFGELLGFWDRFKIVPGSPKDIAHQELVAIERAKKRRFMEDLTGTSSVRSDAIEKISDEEQVHHIRASEGVIESAEKKVLFRHLA